MIYRSRATAATPAPSPSIRLAPFASARSDPGCACVWPSWASSLRQRAWATGSVHRLTDLRGSGGAPPWVFRAPSGALNVRLTFLAAAARDRRSVRSPASGSWGSINCVRRIRRTNNSTSMCERATLAEENRGHYPFAHQRIMRGRRFGYRSSQRAISDRSGRSQSCD